MLRRVLRQWPIVVACVLAAGIAGFAWSSTQEDQFEAVTTVQLNEVDLASLFLNQNLQQQGQDARAKTATTAELILMPRVREAASRAVGGRITPDELRTKIAVETTGSTTLVKIKATDTDPAFAAALADAMRTSFIEVRRQTAASQYRGAADEVSRQLGALSRAERASGVGQTLRDRLDQIGTLRAVANGGVVTVQTARIPTQRAAPMPVRTTILALLAGALVGLGLALARARFDDRLRSADEFQEVWDLPLLGLIPETSGLKDTGGRAFPPPASLEAFAMARTNLRYLHVGGHLRRVVVTSGLEGEGKSTVTWNLAIASALAGSKVLVIDADLRRPVIGERVHVGGGPGLSEVLAGIAEPAKAIREVGITGPGAAGCTVHVVPAGMVPPSPIALLERPETAACFDALADGFDVVLVDTPPATVVADAKMLLEFVDGVIVVARTGRARRATIRRLRDTLDGLGTPVLGAVFNGGAQAKEYGYSSYTSAQPAASASAAGLQGAATVTD